MVREETSNGLGRISKTERERETARRGVVVFLRKIDRLVTIYNPNIQGNEEYSTPFKRLRLGDNLCEVQAQAFYGADRKIVSGTLHIVGSLKGKPVNARRSLSIYELPDEKTLNLRLKFASAVARIFLSEPPLKKPQIPIRVI